MKAAVFNEINQPLTIEEVDIAPPLDKEVVVRSVASGVCHSDVHFWEGHYPMRTPAILGHESAGIVEAIGKNVTYVQPGDHVILCVSVFCGQCRQCLSGHPHLCEDMDVRRRPRSEAPRLSMQGKPVTQLASIGGYAEKMITHENGVVKIDNDYPLDRAALIGCGVTTGLGAVLNTAKVEPGSSVAVFGAGGVGLSVIQGAKIAGAAMIISVELNEFKLATAQQMGATHVIDASSHDPVEAIQNLTNGGADYSFEAIGIAKVAEQAYEAIRPGGTATIVGMIPVGENLQIEGRTFLQEKKLQGSLMGSNRFRIDMPKYIELDRQGRLQLGDMITRRLKLEDVNEAFRAMKAENEVARQVMMFE